MSNEIVNFAAKAFGTSKEDFDPLTNPADTAEMCAKLWINTKWVEDEELSYVKLFNGFGVASAFVKDHDNSRLKAWMFAATMISEKIGGYEDEF